MAAMILTSCPEWCLLQGIAFATGGVKGRLAKIRLNRSKSSGRVISTPFDETESNDLAFLETELRSLLMWETPYAKPVRSTYDDLVQELENVCKILETKVNPQLIRKEEDSESVEASKTSEERISKSYPDLYKLRKVLEDAWNETSKLCLVNGSYEKLFVVPKDEAETILATVTQCNELVLQLSAQRVTSSSPTCVSVYTGNRLPNQTTVVLRALFEEFSRCKLVHELLLCLPQEPDQAAPLSTIDLFLSCSACQGQRHEARFLPLDKRYDVEEVPDLCFELQSWRPGTLLQLIYKHQGLFNISNLSPVRSETLIHSLEDLLPRGIFQRKDISNFQRKDQFSAKEKTILAIKLARCFLDFVDANHAVPMWDTQKVFLATRTSSKLQQGQLYVCFIWPVDDEEECKLQCGNPVFLDFAKLLLEIEEGQKIDLSSCEDPFSKVGKLCGLVSKVQALGRKQYAEAVKNCLLYPPNLVGYENPQAAVRKVISELVIANLEAELSPPDPPRAKRRRSIVVRETTYGAEDLYQERTADRNEDDFTTRSTVSSFKRARVNVEVQAQRDRTATSDVSDNRDTALCAELPHRTTNHQQPASIPDGQLFTTCQWIEKFKLLRKQAMPQGHSSTIRIAVLDTGYRTDRAHHARTGQKVSKRWKDFIGTSAVPESAPAIVGPHLSSATPLDEDESLHGTRIVNLLYDLLPDVEIYVARVIKNVAGLAEAQQAILAAIKYAVGGHPLSDPSEKEPTGWNVDIVTMSFESSFYCKEVEDAIYNAQILRNRRVLFFAAAGNEGGNSPEFYPAAFDGVISVRGTYGSSGFISQYNPDPQVCNEGKPLFGTLAYRVPCGSNGAEMSGCSIATPILAATAAIFIEFATSWSSSQGWTKEQQRRLECIRTRAGIQELVSIFSWSFWRT
ncbi:hypothetical protein DE146DRAFT_790176 [Phaeosphaeria sp. MPI-PUGE-AT-0046c]|nr:hypothetical protein DE146DRAFT_790176 [Phaeosphaeria sp. MPI-PUGE-AT-0046c]